MPAVHGTDIPQCEPERSRPQQARRAGQAGARQGRRPAAPAPRDPVVWREPPPGRARSRFPWTLIVVLVLALVAGFATAQLGPRPTTVRQPAATAVNVNRSASAPRSRAGRPPVPSAPKRAVKPPRGAPRTTPSAERVSPRERIAEGSRAVFRGAARLATRTTQGVVRTVTHYVPRAVEFVARVIDRVGGA